MTSLFGRDASAVIRAPNVEFTATITQLPTSCQTSRNVTAQELKREEVIKAPIRLTEHADGKARVSGGYS